MTLTRRKTLAILGGGSILAASSMAYAVTRPQQTALLPWASVGQYADPRQNALSYAILAPNPHNRQPWIVDLSVPDQVTLYVDTDRLLPHTDPFNRQIVIGLGCFLEVMTLAAGQQGDGVDIDLFPDGDDPTRLDQRPVAVARFRAGAGVAEPLLFNEILNRRSLKDPYDTEQPVADDALAALRGAAIHGSRTATSNDRDQVAALRDVTAEALRTELNTPHTYRESVDLFRIGRREIDANPDGIDLSGPMFETLRLTGLFSREAALDPEGMAFQSGLDMVTQAAMTGMAYAWLTTDSNGRYDQIHAGRDWVRLNLAATALGLGVHPMSQALQEFPEMAEQFNRVHELLAPEGGTVQMLARLGYGPTVGQSPRWPLEAKLRNA